MVYPGTYNANSEIKVKTVTLKSSWCGYNDNAYILIKGKIIVAENIQEAPMETINQYYSKIVHYLLIA